MNSPRSLVLARRMTSVAGGALFAIGAMTACDSLLEASAPSRILESTPGRRR